MTDAPENTSLPAQPDGQRITARALLIADRLDTAGLERSDSVSTTPLAFQIRHEGGFVALFRFGVVVLIGLTPFEEDEVLRSLDGRIKGEFTLREEESAIIVWSGEREDQDSPG